MLINEFNKKEKTFTNYLFSMELSYDKSDTSSL